MKKTILLVGLITLAAFVSGVMAQGKPATTPAPASTKPAPHAQLEKFTGKIKSMDATAKSIVVAKGKTEKTVVIDGSTKITKGKDAASLADLKAGLNVAIEARKERDKLIAATINVVAPEPASLKK